MQNPQKKGCIVPLFLAMIAVVGAVGGGVYISENKNTAVPVVGDIQTSTSEETKQTTITVIDADWKQLRNDKYHYQINIPTIFPAPPKVTGEAEHLRIMYDDSSSGKRIFFASIDISLIGLLNEPIEETASRIASGELFQKTMLDGNEAIKIHYKETYGDTAIRYGAILVRNKQNLNFLLRIDTIIDSQYQELLEKSVQTFQFVDQRGLAVTKELTLSGKVSVRSGNCMPMIGGKGGCHETPMSATVLIYPLRNQNSSFTGEKHPLLFTTAKSDKNGNYAVALPPGTYSVYVDDNGQETCNGSDGYANMCGITLYESDEEKNIVIDHAVY